MKKRILILAVALCAAMSAAAQDTIYKTDAKTIQAKILEISPSEVRYKRFTNPDGPTYVLPVTDISHIVYQNGERDDFNPQTAPTPAPEVCPEPQTVPPSVQTAPAPAPAPQSDGDGNPVTMLPKEERRIEVPAKDTERREKSVAATRPELGRIYDDNGVRGVVIALDASGMHGVMLSLTESSSPRFLPWTTIRNPYPDTGATDKLDGRKNMEAVERYIEEHGASWEDFPAFKWCRDLGDGWYLPAIDELLSLGFCYNGQQRMKFDRHARQQFSNVIKDAGGMKVDAMANYYSSTSTDRGLAATSTMEIEPPFVQPYKMHEKYLVRAVRRF